jgi:hypothetical protein
MDTDRRTNRSHFPGEALTLALAATAERTGARAAVLADEDGLLVAGSGEGIELQWVAAFAPATGDLSGTRRETLHAITKGSPLHVAPIRIEGARLFFASVGGSLSELAHIEAAADRILS